MWTGLNAAGGRAGRPPGAWAVGRPTLHGKPVRLRPVEVTLCYRLEAMIRPNIGFTLRGNLAVFTRSAITPPIVMDEATGA